MEPGISILRIGEPPFSPESRGSSSFEILIPVKLHGVMSQNTAVKISDLCRLMPVSNLHTPSEGLDASRIYSNVGKVKLSPCLTN
jgi:hypothetical protein